MKPAASVISLRDKQPKPFSFRLLPHKQSSRRSIAVKGVSETLNSDSASFAFWPSSSKVLAKKLLGLHVSDKTLVSQMIEYQACVLFRINRNCLQNNLGHFWSFVRIIDAREANNFAAPSFCVHSLGISFFTNLNRRVDEHFNEPIYSNHISHVISGGAIRTNRGANGDAAVSDNFRRHKANTPNISVAIFFAEPEAFRKMRADNVTIKHSHSAAAFD